MIEYMTEAQKEEVKRDIACLRDEVLKTMKKRYKGLPTITALIKEEEKKRKIEEKIEDDSVPRDFMT